MMPLEHFMSSRESIYTTKSASWSSIPGAVFWWGLRLITIADPSKAEDKLPQGKFVITQNLEAAAKAFESSVSKLLASSPFERTFSKTHFQKSFADILGDPCLSEADTDVLVKFLTRDKSILASDGNAVRIKSSPEELPVLTEEDAAIASLKELIAHTTSQTQELSARVQDLSDQARDAVAKENRLGALAALKSKKQAEAQLKTRYDTLVQLDEVAHKLEQAANQVQLVSIMKSSAGTLKSLNAKIGGAKHVADVLDGLREQMGDVDEVGNMIADASMAVDEGDVDDEFEAFEREEKRRKEEAEEEAKEEEEARKAKELKQKLAAAEPPTAVPPGAESQKQEAEETGLVEGFENFSLVNEPQVA